MGWWEWLQTEWQGLSLGRWVVGALLLVLAYFLRRLFSKGLSRLLHIALRSEAYISRAELERLMRPAWIFLILLTAFYTTGAILRFLHLAQQYQDLIHRAFQGLFLIAGGFIVSRILAVLETILISKYTQTNEPYKGQLIHPLFGIVRILVFILVVLFILQQSFGINIAAFLTGLGLGGLAIALAAQETLQHFIGALVIFTDRPFQLGEVIQLESGITGTLERIGLRSTQIRTVDGLLLIVPNKKLVDSIVFNLSRADKRRVWIRIGLLYQTPEPVLAAIRKDILEAIAKWRFILSNPAPQVLFTNYLDSSLEISVIVFYDPNYVLPETGMPITLLEAQDKLNTLLLQIIRRYKPQTGFAFPTRTLLIEREDGSTLL